MHADLNLEDGNYSKNSCEHGNYLLKLDTHFSEIFSLKDSDFQRARKKYIASIANKRISDTQKYFTLRLLSKKQIQLHYKILILSNYGI